MINWNIVRNTTPPHDDKNPGEDSFRTTEPIQWKAGPAAMRLADRIVELESRAAEAAKLLHDQPAQTLTALGLQIAGAKPGYLDHEAMERSLNQSVDSLREAASLLSTAAPVQHGLRLSLWHLVEQTRARGVAIDLRLAPDTDDSACNTKAIARIIELAVDNIVRHAGVSSARVTWLGSGGSVIWEIRDWGTGFDPRLIDPEHPGSGIILMDSYARLNGLELIILSVIKQGTIVRIQTR